MTLEIFWQMGSEQARSLSCHWNRNDGCETATVHFTVQFTLSNLFSRPVIYLLSLTTWSGLSCTWDLMKWLSESRDSCVVASVKLNICICEMLIEKKWLFLDLRHFTMVLIWLYICAALLTGWNRLEHLCWCIFIQVCFHLCLDDELNSCFWHDLFSFVTFTLSITAITISSIRLDTWGFLLWW